MKKAIHFAQDHYLHVVILVFAAIWGLLAFAPRDRTDWAAENTLLFAFLLLLAFTYRRFRFSSLSYSLLAIFLLLHTFGSHYSYVDTPIDPWLKNLFHSKRSLYDRLVHGSFGLLLVYPAYEVLISLGQLRRLWASLLAPAIILACSALYELGEMWMGQWVAPELAERFLATQGDPLDAQRDMEMAFYGAIAALLLTVMLQRLRRTPARDRNGGAAKRR